MLVWWRKSSPLKKNFQSCVWWNHKRKTGTFITFTKSRTFPDAPSLFKYSQARGWRVNDVNYELFLKGSSLLTFPVNVLQAFPVITLSKSAWICRTDVFHQQSSEQTQDRLSERMDVHADGNSRAVYSGPESWGEADPFWCLSSQNRRFLLTTDVFSDEHQSNRVFPALNCRGWSRNVIVRGEPGTGTGLLWFCGSKRVPWTLFHPCCRTLDACIWRVGHSPYGRSSSPLHGTKIFRRFPSDLKILNLHSYCRRSESESVKSPQSIQRLLRV